VLGRLHIITGSWSARDPLEIIERVLRAGAPVVQIRGKACTDRELYEVTARVVERCAAFGATCIVDDRAHVAVAAGAHGVHVGVDDLPVAAARRVVGAGLVGATARDPETARRHEADGAAYLGVGPCYPSTSKPGLPASLGVDGLHDVTEAVSIPVIAISGVTDARVAELIEAGAHGVAVIGAVWDADDPGAAVERLLHALAAAA
jgi:thiamine-phosphate pyrophosphorylase